MSPEDEGRCCSSKERMAELLTIIQRKEEFAQTLLTKLNQQEKQMVGVLTQCEDQTTKIPFKYYSQFLFDSPEKDIHVLLKIKKESISQEEPIWLSRNVSLCRWAAPETTTKSAQVQAEEEKENDFESTLSSDVHQLRENLQKYESMITSLKELKEMEQIEKQQLETQSPPNREGKLKRYIQTLEKEIFQCRDQVNQAKQENAQLSAKLSAVEEKEKDYCSQIRELKLLESRFHACNEGEGNGRQVKRKPKTILLNY